MSDYLDELKAEREVNHHLLTELTRRDPMSHYLKLHDGQIVSVPSFEVVSAEELAAAVAEQEKDLDELKKLQEQPKADEPKAPEDPAPGSVTPSVPAPEAPAAPVEPAEPMLEVNDQMVPANADGSINMDTTPSQPATAEPTVTPAPQPPVAPAAQNVPAPVHLN